MSVPDDKKYSADEIEAAYALLALSNSAPASPPGYRTVVVEPGPSAPSANVANGGKQPIASQPPQKEPQQTLASQMSPLAELNCFVSVALPAGDERYVYNHYASSQTVSFKIVCFVSR